MTQGIPFDFILSIQQDYASKNWDGRYVVDYQTKKIILPDGEPVVIGVQGDMDSRRVYFRLKRKPDDLDLSQCDVEVTYINANQQTGRYLVRDLEVEGEDVTFSMLIPAPLAAYSGDVTLGICAHTATREWHAAPATFRIQSFMNMDLIEADDPQYDILNQLMVDIRELQGDVDDAVEQLNNASAVLTGLESAVTSGGELSGTLGDKITAATGIMSSIETETENALGQITTLRDNALTTIQELTQYQSVTTLDTAILKGTDLLAVHDGDGFKKTTIEDLGDKITENVATNLSTLRGSISDLTTDLAATKGTFLALSDSLGDLSATISNLFTIQRTGKVYSVKVWKSDVNPTQVCEKLDDNAGLVMEPSSATVEGRDDYADIPLFKWWHCNYETDGVGFRKPTHIAGSAFYSESGSAEVGSLFMTPYYRIQDFEEYQIISISDTKHDGFTTPTGAFDEEGVEHPYMIVPAYMMVQADDGYLRSQPDKPVKLFLSHTIINQAIKAKTPDGDGGQAWMMWLVMMMIMIKTGKKSAQATFHGCTDANYQYMAADVYADERGYFPLTPAQAAKFFVGAPIAVGYADTSSISPIDRSQTTMYSYGVGRVTAIESLSSSVTAVYVDIPPFATADVGEAKVYLSFWPWYTGSTKGVKGHHDGALVNDTKHPFRVHGIELSLGCYEIPSDLAVTVNAQNGRILYRRPMGMTSTIAQAQIESDYELVGEIPNLNAGLDYFIGDYDMSNEIGTPISMTSSAAYGAGDKMYWGAAAAAGCREWLRLPNLSNGSGTGLGNVYLWSPLSSTSWARGGRG